MDLDSLRLDGDRAQIIGPRRAWGVPVGDTPARYRGDGYELSRTHPLGSVEGQMLDGHRDAEWGGSRRRLLSQGSVLRLIGARCEAQERKPGRPEASHHRLRRKSAQKV